MHQIPVLWKADLVMHHLGSHFKGHKLEGHLALSTLLKPCEEVKCYESCFCFGKFDYCEIDLKFQATLLTESKSSPGMGSSPGIQKDFYYPTPSLMPSVRHFYEEGIKGFSPVHS